LARILIVDDDPQITMLVRIALVRVGHEVEEANCGEDAVAAVLAHPPDLVLLDYVMPDLSGAEVIEQLRRHPECACVPIVMATGELEPDEYPHVLQVLGKPYKLDELYAAVNAALAR
jgi:two-component system phosphate regulon response regulator PhoB